MIERNRCVWDHAMAAQGYNDADRAVDIRETADAVLAEEALGSPLMDEVGKFIKKYIYINLRHRRVGA
jgi:hypothetical protein